MKTDLACYLSDHLAGASAAIELLGTLARIDAASEWSSTLASLLRDIQADERMLVSIRHRISSAPDGWKRRLSRWLAKIARRRFPPDEFGVFEAVEVLMLGVRGKEALWDALMKVHDDRLRNIDFEDLRRRARAQRDILERMRLAFAEKAFSVREEPASVSGQSHGFAR